MIRENITVTIGNDSFSGELTAPSVVMTSKPQEEVLDLTKTPNFVLKLEDTNGSLNVTNVVEVAFTAGNKSYTANAKVYNKAGKYVALQYMDGLTAEDVPETHTLEFDSSNYDTEYDIYTGTKSQVTFNVLYNGSPIQLSSDMFSGLVYHKFEPIESGGGIFSAKDALHEISVGQTYVDNVTVTYEGLTASCTVTLTVTDSEAVLTLKWWNGSDAGPILSDYNQDDPCDVFEGVSIRFFDKNGDDVTENIVNNNTINVNFVGYNGRNYDGIASLTTIIDNPEPGELDKILDIKFSNSREWEQYVNSWFQTFWNEEGETETTFSIQCNISVDGYRVSPETFTITSDNYYELFGDV